jgi:hypothetical protein
MLSWDNDVPSLKFSTVNSLSFRIEWRCEAESRQTAVTNTSLLIVFQPNKPRRNEGIQHEVHTDHGKTTDCDVTAGW